MNTPDRSKNPREFSTAPYMVVPEEQPDYSVRTANAVRRFFAMQEGFEDMTPAEKAELASDSLDSFFSQDPVLDLFRLFCKDPERFTSGEITEVKVTIAEPSLKDLNDKIIDSDGADELVRGINRVFERNFADHRDFETVCFTNKGLVALVDFDNLFDPEAEYSDEDRADMIYADISQRLERCKRECRETIETYLRSQKLRYSQEIKENTDKLLEADGDTTALSDRQTILTGRITNINKYLEKLASGEGFVLGFGASPFQVHAEDPRSLEAFKSVVGNDLMSNVSSRQANRRLKQQHEQGLAPGQKERLGVQVCTTYQFPIFDLLTLRAKIVEEILKNGKEGGKDEAYHWARLLEVDEETGDIFDLDGNIKIRSEIAYIIRKKDKFMGSAYHMQMRAVDPKFDVRLALLEEFIFGGIDILDYIKNFTLDDIERYHARALKAIDLEEAVDEIKALLSNGGIDEEVIDATNEEIDAQLKASLKNTEGGNYVTHYGLVARILENFAQGSTLYVGDKKGMWVDNLGASWEMSMEVMEELVETALRDLPEVVKSPEFREVVTDLRPDFEEWVTSTSIARGKIRVLESVVSGNESKSIRIASQDIDENVRSIKATLKEKLLPNRKFWKLWVETCGWGFDEAISEYLLKGCDEPTHEFKSDLELISAQNAGMNNIEIGGDEFTCVVDGITENDEQIIQTAEAIRVTVGARVAAIMIDVDLSEYAQEADDPIEAIAKLIDALSKKAEEELVRAKEDEYIGVDRPIAIFRASTVLDREPDFVYEPQFAQPAQ